jgi:hypothetical protein
MDVRLPDGTVVQNVPDDITRDQLTAKLKSNGYDVSKLEPSKPDATASDRTKAAIGGVNRGISGLLGLPIDTTENIINLGIAAYGKATGTTPDLILNSPGGSQSIANTMERVLGKNAASNPRPDDPVSQMLYRGGTVAGGSMLPGSGVGRTAAAAAGSAAAEQALGPEYAGIGAMVPGAVTHAASAAKVAIANPQTIQENQRIFAKAGTTPDVAQATESNFFRGLTNVVARVPGGQGVISKFREQEQKALGDSAQTGVSAEAAGRTIKSGITGEGGFLERTKNEWLRLDNAVAAKIPGQSSFEPTNTRDALAGLTATTKGAEQTTAGLVNPKIVEIRDNLAADLQANNGEMPFEALRALRSRVGSMLDDSLVSGIPNGELKRLYGALSKDLEAAANEAGAGQEFARQSNYYKARMDRIETTLDKVLGKGREPEDIFKSISPTDVDSVNKIRRTLRSLTPDEREVVSDAVVNRLGRASPGKQDATGDKFSSETFLTNWTRINDSAKSQLFPNADMRSKLDAIAKISDDIKAGKAVFGNTSGTGQAVTAGSVYAAVPAAVGMAATGNVGAAVATLAIAGSMVASANIGAKMLTSPKVVDWLAKSAKVQTPEQMTAQLGRLGVLFNETKDQALKAELSDYINSISNKQ